MYVHINVFVFKAQRSTHTEKKMDYAFLFTFLNEYLGDCEGIFQRETGQFIMWLKRILLLRAKKKEEEKKETGKGFEVDIEREIVWSKKEVHRVLDFL